MVSKSLFLDMKRKHYYGRVHRVPIKFKNIIKWRRSPFECATSDTRIERFRSWINNGATPVDRDKYMIDGEACVDYFIRFEHLRDDIAKVCGKRGIPFEPERIPECKKGHRPEDIAVKAYY